MTTLQQLLGIELPIIQAPMAGVQGSALAVAVSNAGGLGSLPCAMLAPDAMRKELAAIRAQTDRPFNVNFFCHAPPRAGRRSARRPGAPRSRPISGARPRPRSRPARARAACRSSAEAADVLEEFRPPVVSFHFGLPAPELLARVRGWGAKVLSSATTVDEARWLRGARRRRDHRAGPRGRRPSRHVPVGRPHHADGHLRAGAAGRAGGEGAGDRRRRHRRRRRAWRRRWRWARPACRSAPRTCCAPRARPARCIARR